MKPFFPRAILLAAILAVSFDSLTYAELIGGVTVDDCSSENTGFGSNRLAVASIDRHPTFDPVIGSLDSCDRGWMTNSQNTDHEPYISYDLGANYDLGSIRILNWNQLPARTLGHRGQGVKKAVISTAGPDKVYSEVATITVPLATGVDGYTGTLFTINAKNVRYVKVRPLSNYYSETFKEIGENAWKNQVSIAKIQFYTKEPDAKNLVPQIIPFPKECQLQTGRMRLDNNSRIVVTQDELLPVAKIVAEDLNLIVGLNPTTTTASPQPGDMVLLIDKTLKDEEYTLVVNNIATIRAGNRFAVLQGAVTLLQALSKEKGNIQVPKMDIKDEPFVGYRGLMVDCARSYHSPDVLKQMVVLCHWYKIRYLHLHLTDDQAFTFPSKSLPKLSSHSFYYKLEELQDLGKFAAERGITIIPEVDLPGHSAIFLKAYPELFSPKPIPEGGWNASMGPAINVAREEVYQALDKLVGEIVEVFQTSPYFHIGADEVNYCHWDKCPETCAYMAEHGIENTHELYRYFLVRMNEIVKKHGKQTIVWEGFAKEGKIQIPRDVIVQVFECKYNFPKDLLADGYQIINTSWQPLYVVGDSSARTWSPECIYGWNLYQWRNFWNTDSIAYRQTISVPPTSQVIGAQMCAWEQIQEKELPTLRERVPAMSERIWNPGINRPFTDFSSRFRSTDTGLKLLLKGNKKQ